MGHWNVQVDPLVTRGSVVRHPWSITTPRYLTECTLSSETPLIVRLKSISTVLAGCLLIIMKFVLLKLRDSLFRRNQLSTFWSSLFTRFSRFSKLLSDRVKYVSSTNKVVSNSEQFGISFMYIRKNNGPRLDPWGSPQLIRAKFDLELEIFTYWCRFCK